jgi:hypothetical protein
MNNCLGTDEGFDQNCRLTLRAEISSLIDSIEHMQKVERDQILIAEMRRKISTKNVCLPNQKNKRMQMADTAVLIQVLGALEAEIEIVSSLAENQDDSTSSVHTTLVSMDTVHIVASMVLLLLVFVPIVIKEKLLPRGPRKRNDIRDAARKHVKTKPAGHGSCTNIEKHHSDTVDSLESNSQQSTIPPSTSRPRLSRKAKKKMRRQASSNTPAAINCQHDAESGGQHKMPAESNHIDEISLPTAGDEPKQMTTVEYVDFSSPADGSEEETLEFARSATGDKTWPPPPSSPVWSTCESGSDSGGSDTTTKCDALSQRSNACSSCDSLATRAVIQKQMSVEPNMCSDAVSSSGGDDKGSNGGGSNQENCEDTCEEKCVSAKGCSNSSPTPAVREPAEVGSGDYLRKMKPLGRRIRKRMLTAAEVIARDARLKLERERPSFVHSEKQLADCATQYQIQNLGQPEPPVDQCGMLYAQGGFLEAYGDLTDYTTCSPLYTYCVADPSQKAPPPTLLLEQQLMSAIISQVHSA